MLDLLSAITAVTKYVFLKRLVDSPDIRHALGKSIHNPHYLKNNKLKFKKSIIFSVVVNSFMTMWKIFSELKCWQTAKKRILFSGLWL